ncbi:hypothetical protein [Nakamurella leprariae]|uniref:Uncharacterized protein n=1 Tax=Nakamurella leprariae TaxID=2803911 RepID=A0A938YEW5_9ACTN|nr:hypothetical protein [Nakamurella leprariae]MBM9468328.1 hypothetical protein [Nakamurella leprariae]
MPADPATTPGVHPDANPLLEPSPLPFRLPPFADIHEAHYGPAFDLGMGQARRRGV